MARRPKITEATLTKLGVERLAALLVAEAASNRQLKQALELALDAQKGVDGLALAFAKGCPQSVRRHLHCRLTRPAMSP
jgi:hypothetical protein